MNDRDADFLERLRATFRVEAADHLQAIGVGLLALERAPAPADRTPPLEAAFRHTHSLKGAARAAGFPDIEAVCQAIEEVFAHCKRHGATLQADQFDVLHRAFDMLRAWLAEGSPPSAGAAAEVAPMLRQLRALLAQLGPATGATPDAVAAAAASTSDADPAGQVAAQALAQAGDDAGPRPASEHVRVSARRLDRLLLAAEELLTVRQADDERGRELQRLESALEDWNKRWVAIQAPMRRVRGFSEVPAAGGAAARELLEFLDWSHGYVRSLEGRLRVLGHAAARDGHAAARQIDDLLDESKGLLMTSFDAATEGLQRLVRDLGREQGKQPELLIAGDGVQLDKRIVEALKDPLVHLVRNAVDHGIEAAAERRAAGKPGRSAIRIDARLTHGSVVVEIADDGKGLDPQGLRDAAVRAGLLDPAAAAQLDPDAALELAFRSDVSTSPIITEISGRGLGLAIVREHVERLGGRVSMASVVGEGTRFSIVLPQSLATLRGLFVEAGGARFVIPAAQVRRVASFPREALRTVGRRPTLNLAGATVAVSSLADLLELPARPAEGGAATFVVLGTDRDELAVEVDEVLEDTDVLARQLRPPLVRVRNLAGATVLASGKVVPILNVADLLKAGRRDAPRERPAAVPAPVATRAARVLLAEDSITSRLLLKGILEGAGCEVKTAADGIEAYTALRSEAFDLLVSDIEMPRLNGFDLTARIRSDRALSALPVILVTALSRREDRERGIDVGANAYIAKGGFDQRDLLDAIRRLVPGVRE